ncbi:Cationic amino acid transporter 6, chloroplastic [Capsicum baccatum]|uniref:Cationic amino acid transporter 6, chloroplastic n=1 Tax=Capsicum baccatum TaxID=33114 RepID=A0A2G2VES3_CAPBA|nr:Cationic amino acid transporter 6, chloroplastic [Capsicum baccatum]PHT98084.1 Cationic amino acid transporter 6, chloroplastic [Capsicum chinense]
METYSSSFSSIKSYLKALSDTPFRLARRAGSVSTSFEERSRVRARSGGDMKKSLRWYDLVGFGIGGMVGAGVFVTSGQASRVYAGPAVVLSYAIAGFCALLSAFCYTEFAVDLPVAGGAFSYIRITFGEFLAFLTGANLIIDYVLSNAAVARSFTGYLCTALGISNKLRITVSELPKGFNEIDVVAVLVVLFLTVIICYSTRESSMLNLVLTVLHLVFIVFVIVIGFTRGHTKNFTKAGDTQNHASGFFPYGASGVFNGAAMVYLSYIGYDAVSTMAEEVKNPVKDIPAGVSGSVILVTVLYCLMAASMSMLLPYDMIDPDAPFSGAFMGSEGWRWVSNVIGGGASFGILTSLLVAMLGQARYMCVIGRSSVVPAWFAKVHPKTSTPLNASLFLGLCTAAIALFTDLQILLNLVSIGTLFVFYMVANAVIYKRYVAVGVTNPWPTLSFLFCFSLTSILFTLLWQLAPPGKPKACMLGACTAIAIAVLQLFHYMVPQAQKPEFWGVPLMPWIPSMSIFLNIFLLGSLDRPSYVRFGFFSALAVLFYVLYSVHASFDAEEDGTLSQKSIELVKESIEVQDHTLKV